MTRPVKRCTLLHASGIIVSAIIARIAPPATAVIVAITVSDAPPSSACPAGAANSR
ncbi:hypothetical protein ACFWVP_09550 [Streptomyces sp. NPDC058637]|uniref:hypothetical protein n=1 Tax=Streptomyces sp. NPDC058637 TaxID=3346569 RepID=UPI0036569A0F